MVALLLGGAAVIGERYTSSLIADLTERRTHLLELDSFGAHLAEASAAARTFLLTDYGPARIEFEIAKTEAQNSIEVLESGPQRLGESGIAAIQLGRRRLAVLDSLLSGPTLDDATPEEHWAVLDGLASLAADFRTQMSREIFSERDSVAEQLEAVERVRRRTALGIAAGILVLVAIGRLAAHILLQDMEEQTRQRKELERRASALEREHAATQAARERVTSVLSSIADGFLAVNHDWILTHVNAQAQRLLDIDPDTSTGRPLWDAVPSFAGMMAEEPIRRAMEQSVPVAADVQIPATLLWVDLRAYPTQDGLSIFLNDITEKRNAALALAESEAYLRLLAENTGDLVILYSLTQRVLYASPSVTSALPLSADALRAHTPAEWTHPDDLGDFEAAFGRLIAGDSEVEQFEARYQTPTGTWRWYDVVARVAFNAEGERIGIQTSSRDSTAKRAAAEALAKSQARLELLATNTLDVVALHDLNGNYTYISPSHERVLGYPPDQLIGQHLSTLAHPDDTHRVVEFIREALRTEAPATARTLIARYRSKNSGEIWLETIASQVRGKDDSVTALISSTRDITDRQRLEEQFQQSQKLEGLGRLASGVAHDFNNLLTVIAGNADLLLLHPGLGESIELQDIVRATVQASALTRQLLRFSRKQPLSLRSVDLNALVTEDERMLTRVIGPQISLASSLHPDLAPVIADRHQLGQVLMNLVINAVDAMPNGGQILITTSAIELSEAQATQHGCKPGNFSVLSVRDTGIGMDLGTVAQIFEPFFTTKAPGIGTGLGLATVDAIVQQAGGFIRVDSAPGKGTTFHIHLPAASPKAAALDVEHHGIAAPPTTGAERVLVVEDEYLVRQTIRRMLEASGYHVIDVDSGFAAIHTIIQDERASIDLLITDMLMPEMNGIELIEWVRVYRPGIPIILLSGYPREDLTATRRLAPDIHTVMKPLVPERFLHDIRAALAHTRSPEALEEERRLIARREYYRSRQYRSEP